MRIFHQDCLLFLISRINYYVSFLINVSVIGIFFSLAPLLNIDKVSKRVGN